MGEFKIKRGAGEKPVLALLSDSYSELKVLVSVNRLSSYPALHYLLTTYTTNYHPN